MKSRLFDWNRVTLALLLTPAAILAPAPILHAQVQPQSQPPEDDDYMGESPERYAQVKAVEGDVRISKGDGEEALTRGIPVGEGDVVESRGRGVLQLGDGTRIAFANATKFQVAALFTDRKGERQVLLRLDYGRIRIMMGSESDARIRIDTPSGTVALADGASASCEVDREHSVQVRVHRGRARFRNEADRTTLTAGERLTVYGNQDRLDRVRSFNTYDADPFDEWCVDYLRARRSAHSEHIPREISSYSDDLDDNGDWIYVDDTSSWCWRPRGVSVEWRPYWQGRWGAYAGGMTWISDEPWGYVTHHHGRWGWGARYGWYWIPGVYYSPAWVAWNTYDTFFGWAPLGYWNAPCTWGYGAWGGGHCWNVVNVTYIGQGRLQRHIYADVNVIRTFNRGTGASSWSGTGTAGRPLTAPWQRGPLMVSRGEINNPTQFQRVVGQRPLMRERIQTYERQAQSSTGRAVLRRDVTPLGRPESPSGGRLPTPFEDRSRPTPGRAILRESRPIPPETSPAPPRDSRPVGREVAPSGGRETRPREIERPTPKEAPRERVREERPREIERPTPKETPRERIREERPREVERPTPREIPRERVREERPREIERPAPKESPRESPRETHREAPRESRPERPSSPAPSAPAPSPSRPVERPRR